MFLAKPALLFLIGGRRTGTCRFHPGSDPNLEPGDAGVSCRSSGFASQFVHLAECPSLPPK